MPGRATLTAATLSLLCAGALAALPAGAAPGGGGCQLHGTAKFVHGPNSTAHSFTYTFTGKLSGCQDDSGKAPATGTVRTLLPAKGSGTCQNGTTSGITLITWADKTATVIKYTTQDAGAEVVLQGNAVPSYKVGKKAYKTTRYAGDGALANLVFEADPSQCAGSGVTSAAIDGFAGIGSQS
jgi:hypothetical protein